MGILASWTDLSPWKSSANGDWSTDSGDDTDLSSASKCELMSPKSINPMSSPVFYQRQDLAWCTFHPVTKGHTCLALHISQALLHCAVVCPLPQKILCLASNGGCNLSGCAEKARQCTSIVVVFRRHLMTSSEGKYTTLSSVGAHLMPRASSFEAAWTCCSQKIRWNELCSIPSAILLPSLWIIAFRSSCRSYTMLLCKFGQLVFQPVSLLLHFPQFTVQFLHAGLHFIASEYTVRHMAIRISSLWSSGQETTGLHSKAPSETGTLFATDWLFGSRNNKLTGHMMYWLTPSIHTSYLSCS